MNDAATVAVPPEAARATLVEVRDLRLHLEERGRSVPVVDGVSFRLFVGGALAIIGESGSGKSLTCRSLLGLLPRYARVSGSIQFEGKEFIGLTERELRQHRGADIAMVFQDTDNTLNPTIRVGLQIAEAIRLHMSLDRKLAKRRALDVMHDLGIMDPDKVFCMYPHQLSGGLRQRIMIAIALAAGPKVLIADEATRSLDLINQAQIMQLLLMVRRTSGMAVILVSHDLALARRYSDETLVMYGGRPVEHGATQAVFARPRMPYTKALLDAIPDLERRRGPVIEGQCPAPGARPAGCAFSPRCPKATATCFSAQPPFKEAADGHKWACWYPYEYGDRSP